MTSSQFESKYYKETRMTQRIARIWFTMIMIVLSRGYASIAEDIIQVDLVQINNTIPILRPFDPLRNSSRILITTIWRNFMNIENWTKIQRNFYENPAINWIISTIWTQNKLRRENDYWTIRTIPQKSNKIENLSQ